MFVIPYTLEIVNISQYNKIHLQHNAIVTKYTIAYITKLVFTTRRRKKQC